MTRISLLLVLFLIGCASTPTERSYYLLRAEVPGTSRLPIPMRSWESVAPRSPST